jgi:hypothetical protein
MIIDWRYYCFVCDHPIDLRVCPETMRECMAYYHYRYLYNPAPVYLNLMYYKFIDKRVRRVCFDCFERHKKPNFKALRDREIGRCRMRPRTFRSLTRDELVTWIRGMQAFMYPPESDA